MTVDNLRPNDEDTILYELERQCGVVRDRVRDVASRRHTSLYLYGPRGTAKTYLVRNTLDAIGELYEYDAGHLTPLGFFDLLGEHSDDTIVIDDVSSLFTNKIGQQMLLASLGVQSCGDSTRVITYQRRNLKEVVYFTGGLIVISNIELHSGDVMGAIKSRTKPLCWDPTDAQLAAMMRDVVKNGWKRGDVSLTAEECRQVVDFLIEESRRYGARLDLRLLFDGALPDFAATKAGEHETDWRDHTGMALKERVRRLQFSGPPKTRAERMELERKIAERIRAGHNTKAEQVAAWVQETGKSEKAYERRVKELRIAT